MARVLPDIKLVTCGYQGIGTVHDGRALIHCAGALSDPEGGRGDARHNGTNPVVWVPPVFTNISSVVV